MQAEVGAESGTFERIDQLIDYLQRRLTHRLPVTGRVYTLYIYNETQDGMSYALRAADDISHQGAACTDDVTRAIVLACDLFMETGSSRARRVARQWSTFLRHVELRERPGVYAPFVYADGRLNIGGFNSRPPSKWAQGNTARAWARLWAAFGDHDAAAQFWAVRRKSTPDMKAVANRVDGDLTAYEVADASGDELSVQKLRSRIEHDVERIVANREANGAFSDFRRGAEPARLRGTIQLWGYHQLMSVARAARILGRPDWLDACVATVEAVIVPLIESESPRVPYAWPVDSHDHPRAWPDEPSRWTGTAYHVSSLVAGLAELYLATGEPQYGDWALHVADWLLGDNPAAESMYHPTYGGCYDGILDGVINRNMGAESTIEAARAELYRLKVERSISAFAGSRFSIGGARRQARLRDPVSPVPSSIAVW